MRELSNFLDLKTLEKGGGDRTDLIMLYESKPTTNLENFKASFLFHSFPSGLYIHFMAWL